MLFPQTDKQKEIHQFYGKFNWKAIVLSRYTYWHRRKVKNAALLAICVQFQHWPINLSDVVDVIGLPNQIEGTLYNGIIFYTYTHSSDQASGHFGIAIGVEKGRVSFAGSNRMDCF